MPTAANQALDGDVILADQTLLIDGVVITSNRKHLSRFIEVKEWSEVAAE